MNLLIKNGYLIDPSRGLQGEGDICIGGSVFIDKPEGEKAEVFDASGLWVLPGLVDAHVHLREPGHESKETIETGLAAAAAGGYTVVLAMPNTVPPNDSVEMTKWMFAKALELGGTRLFPVPAVTIGRKGVTLTDMEELVRAGAVAFSDDGSGVENDELMESALLMSARLCVPIAQHSECSSVSGGGVVHEGRVSRSLGLLGWPAEAEEAMVKRDIELVRKTGGHLHVSHISTAGSAALVRAAKKEGLNVTAEVTPHHLLFTDELVLEGSTVAKVNPPLRPWDDVQALREALVDKTIDIIATDHAPHTDQDKAGGFVKAAFGMIGLETAVPAILRLVAENVISPMRMVEAMSTAPARIFSVPGGCLSTGMRADLTIVDPNLEYVLEPEQFHSKSRNCPFLGKKLKGRVVRTYIDGELVFSL